MHTSIIKFNCFTNTLQLFYLIENFPPYRKDFTYCLIPFVYYLFY